MINNVDHPQHYQGKIEVIDYLEDKLTTEQLKGFCLGNSLKYLSRFQNKNGVEDLKKARWYLNMLIGIEETREVEDSQLSFEELKALFSKSNGIK